MKYSMDALYRSSPRKSGTQSSESHGANWIPAAAGMSGRYSAASTADHFIVHLSWNRSWSSLTIKATVLSA